MLVTVVTPTYGRAHLLSRLYRSFARQTHADLELIILDDSPAPAEGFAALGDRRVRYVHDPVRRSIGEKRNRLIELARGEVIVHFDDDDLYAESYVATVLDKMSAADFFTLSTWHLWRAADRSLWHWDTARIVEPHYVVGGTPREPLELFYPHSDKSEEQRRRFVDGNLWGYGFSYAYRRAIARRTSFPDRDHGEDAEFVARLEALGARLAAAADPDGLALHVVHAGSSSRCFPQYRLPAHQLTRLLAMKGLSPEEALPG